MRDVKVQAGVRHTGAFGDLSDRRMVGPARGGGVDTP